MPKHRPASLPIKIDSTSNGEFLPSAVPQHLQAGLALADERLRDLARYVGLPRRQFLQTSAAAAATLLTLNTAHAARDPGRAGRGGHFALAPETAYDIAAADAALQKDDLIFDVQTHLVDPNGAWRDTPGRGFERVLAWWPQGSCGLPDPTDCYDAEHFIKEVFLDSDTDAAVLSFIPAPAAYNPLSAKEADRVRRLVDMLDGDHRLYLHSMVLPNLPPHAARLAEMAEAVAQWPIAAWKVYTQWGPRSGGRVGWALDDPAIGIPFIEQARALGVPRICIHKGFPLRRMAPEFATCEDVGRAARLFPDVTFIIYHSGYDSSWPEQAYNPAEASRGVDSLVKSLIDNGIPPNSNVYAELGSTWRAVMRDSDQAAHTLGKLLKYVGEERVLWGTDSIWYGSPQDQILALRAFVISDAFQEKYGYPALTPQLKARIFGLNALTAYGVDAAALRRKAANDTVQKARLYYREQSAPSYLTYGPRTRRGFMALERQRGGYPD